ncbi:MAG: diguanylate cyclase [Bryobacterales bacterium]|nr:diguanylate cyclase [Bryobacterales bacterium]
MLSLKKTIEGLNREEQRFQALRACYLAALNAVQEHAIEVAAEATGELRRRVQRLYRELSEGSDPGAFENSRGVLVEVLKDYRLRSDEALAQKDEDLHAIITTLATAAETLSEHNDSHSATLKEFAAQFQHVARGRDLGRMRTELTRRVGALRSAAESMWHESQSSISEMQLQLRDFQKRLEQAEDRATIDALTGVLNRGEGELRLRKAIDAGSLVCVILVDLDGFKRVNDRWGHTAGDQVLKTFALTLSQDARASDAVSRWGGDEFLLMMNGNEEAAQQRAAKLRVKLRIRHGVVVLGRVVEVEVGASIGVAQARAGESVEDLLTRADVQLYEDKGVAHRAAPRTMTLEGGA